MRKSLLFIILINLFYYSNYAQKSNSFVDYVDSRIGTTNDGSNCVIGPQLPFGSINPSPQTPNGNHDGYDPDQPIRGFGQLHVSGIGWGKYGQVFISPQIGLAVGETEHDSPKSNENAYPYEYRTTLSRYNIRAEVTPSYHSAIYRFIFPKSDESHIIIDLSHNIPQDIATFIGGEITEGSITIDADNSKITGYGKYSGGFGQGIYPVYFTAEFSKKPDDFGTWKDGKINNHVSTESIHKTNEKVGAYLKFKTSESDTIFMKIAVSLKSNVRSEEWLTSEIENFNYDKVKENAITAWNNELSKISIETTSDQSLKIFYTALYHSMLMPRNRTNDMQGFEDSVAVWDDQFAVWDTWRTLFPLMSLVNPEMVAGNVNSFIGRYQKNGMVKDAFIAGFDMAEEQGGNNVDNIITDAFVKKVEGVDWEEAYKVIKYDADEKRNGWQGWNTFEVNNQEMNCYKELGWIPAGTMSCSYTLEYAYNDFCASLMANGLNKKEDFEIYRKRSEQWQQLWNSKAKSNGYKGFIVPRKKNGEWINIDISKNWGSWNNYYYEGNAWTYSYFVPHDFAKLVYLSGGKEAYAEKLNFAMKNDLIDYSNEPAFLTAHSFIYAGRPDLSSYWVRKLMTEGYSLKGYPGNDDSGAMSSWYIFASLGLFPNAGQDIYYLIGALHPKSTIQLSNGNQLVIEAENASEENLYVQSCTINGDDWDKAWIKHDQLLNGTIIKFKMGNKPSNWAQTDHSLDFDSTNFSSSKKKK